MTTVGVTGAAGMIGWHALCVLRARGIDAVAANRETFGSTELLDDFVRNRDVILHFAGMNRGDSHEIESTNVALAEWLTSACDRVETKPHLVFSNSVHRDRADAYGRSKAKAAQHLADWAAARGARFTDLILPHVFGEGGRPFYNSVVSTFAHQIARDECPTIMDDGWLELIHAQDAVAAALDEVAAGRSGEVRVDGYKMRVSELLGLLRSIDSDYTATGFPALADPLHLRLFNVLRDHSFPRRYPLAVPAHSDPRGSFFEVAKTTTEGQTSFSSTRPGVTRGNHFHLRKVERFLVVDGEAVIRVRRLFGDEVFEFAVSGADPAAVDMPTMHTHSITNVGESDLLTLFWINEIFDESTADTYPEAVIQEELP